MPANPAGHFDSVHLRHSPIQENQIERPAGDKGLYFLPLGGSGEIGMNLNLYGHGGKWLMIDLGVMFGDIHDSVGSLRPREVELLRAKPEGADRSRRELPCDAKRECGARAQFCSRTAGHPGPGAATARHNRQPGGG